MEERRFVVVEEEENFSVGLESEGEGSGVAGEVVCCEAEVAVATVVFIIDDTVDSSAAITASIGFVIVFVIVTIIITINVTFVGNIVGSSIATATTNSPINSMNRPTKCQLRLTTR